MIFHRGSFGALALLTSFFGCAGGSPTYPAAKLAESVQNLCLKEYNLSVNARLVGRTFYVSCKLEGLVGRDLSLQKKTLDTLEGAMLSSTRVLLSTDAPIDFQVLQARDSRLGVTVTLLRCFPDIKGLFYLRLSRADFEDRLVLESENEENSEAPEAWHDITLMEFVSRLAATRLHRQFNSNPFISVVLQIHRIRGSFQDGTLLFRVNKVDAVESIAPMSEEILRTAVKDTVLDVLKRYNVGGSVSRVLVRDDADRMLLELGPKEFSRG